MTSSSMFDKLNSFAKSPKAQQVVRDLTAKAHQFANDPKNKQRIDTIRRDVTAKVQQFTSDPKNRQRLDDLRRKFNGGGTTRPPQE